MVYHLKKKVNKLVSFILLNKLKIPPLSLCTLIVCELDAK